MSYTNDEYVAIAKALAAEFSKKTKAELVILCTNGVIRQMIDNEVFSQFLTERVNEQLSEKEAALRAKEELASQAMRALEFNWQAIADLQSDLRAAPKRIATKAAEARAEPMRATEAYAIKLFHARSWKSINQAKEQIWPQVHAEARRLGWKMSQQSGRETLYKWLRKPENQKKA